MEQCSDEEERDALAHQLAALFTRVSLSRAPHNGLCAFAGGALPHTILSCCQGTLLGMFSTQSVLPLRSTCRDAVAAVAAHPWEDTATLLAGSVALWRRCFPSARCANAKMWVTFSRERVRCHSLALSDADVQHFAGLQALNMSKARRVTALAPLSGIHTLDLTSCEGLTDDALAPLAGVKRLSLWWCVQLTDACLKHLGGIETLNISRCHLITGAGFARLRGLRHLLLRACSAVPMDALAHLEGIHTLVLEGCKQEFSAEALAPLAGVQRLCMSKCKPSAIAAAQALGLPVTLTPISVPGAFFIEFDDGTSWQM